MNKFNRLIPYLSFIIATIILMGCLKYVENVKVSNVMQGVLGNSIYFFMVYLFYDLIRQIIITKEKKYITVYIKNKISNDVFVALYFLKKILHGYNLDTNTFQNILDIVNYSQKEILNHVKNQSYLGFQIFKNTDEVRSLFSNALNDNLVSKYSNHFDAISLLRITNNLARLESILNNNENFENCAESGIEFKIVEGKSINPDNSEGYLLLKRTKHSDRFVVYDSGVFEENKVNLLLERYVLKKDTANIVSDTLFETFKLMKHWLPKQIYLHKNESRFRTIKDFFNPSTNSRTNKSRLYVADIIETK